jgi:hypothetical protein
LPGGRFDEYFPEFPADARPALPRLVDLLPPSLEAFMLEFSTVLQRSLPTADHTEFVFFQLPKLLVGFRDERNTKLPRLSDVVFDPPSDLERYADKNPDPEFANSVHSILREVEACGVRWERGVFSCFHTFNERFDVKDAGEDY